MSCPSCGYPDNPPAASLCQACDGALPGAPPGGPAREGRRVIVGMRPAAPAADGDPEQDLGEEPFVVGGVRIPRGLGWVAVGLLPALLFSLSGCGLVELYKNGARLLFHETGHFFAAVFFGHPAIPSAAGMTHVYPQKPLIALAVWGAIAYGAWRFRDARPVAAAFAGLALLYPLLAATRSHEHLISFAGHGFEVAFACFFLWRALSGGFAEELERPLYALLAWMLWGRNVTLWGAIAFGIGTERAVYESIAIAGDNDFVRIADGLGWDLAPVALLMLLYTLALPAATLAVWWFGWRRPADRARLIAWLSFKR